MSTIWKNGSFSVDAYALIDDAADVPKATPVIVSLKRWRESRADVLAAGSPVGVVVDATATLSAETDALDKLALIAIPFPKFTDGRGYSLARRLRDEFQFRGDVRATGEVLIDQIPLMLRCGIDSFAITHAPTLRDLEAGRLPAISEVYQTAATGSARTTAAFTPRPIREAAA
jgi:uncharacterized protein (DUF934 family)